MKLINKTLIVVALMSFSSAWANTHDDASLAHELLDTILFEKMLSDSLDVMLNVQIESQPQLEPFKHIMREFLAMHLSGESLKDDMAAMYRDVYTPEELQGLIDFYKTPLGVKSLELTPWLMAQGASLGQQRVQENIHILERLIQEEVQRISALENK